MKKLDQEREALKEVERLALERDIQPHIVRNISPQDIDGLVVIIDNPNQILVDDCLLKRVLTNTIHKEHDDNYYSIKFVYEFNL